MLLLSGYNILEKISHFSNSLLYRAESVKDQKKVILKILENTSSKNDEAARITNEYEIASGFSCKGIARYLELETYNNKSIAVIANIEGILLEEYVQTYEITIGDALKIAISITEILENLFQKGIVHQALCPAHLLINPLTLEVNVIDFSIASRVSALNRTVEQPNFFKSSLAYISPEQTGRVKREIDTRSDLYSLGIIVYELVTGKVPYEAKEALALIHSHIAKSPVPPHISNPNLPVAFSNIILKLLSKNAADRYQSPLGLKVDLQNCLNQWLSGGQIALSELGRYDFSGRVQNSKQFYGREEEIAALHEAYNRVSNGAVEVVLVEGYSGIGKSAMIRQAKEYIRLHRGVFIESKFNQFQRNVPYFAFIQAFREFTDFILTKSIETIAAWKERILEAIGINGRVLTDIIPHLELLIGPQPAVPDLEPNEVQNRFHYVFINFIKCISQKEHPLVIFFDDLQWSDTASSNLLRIIATDKELGSFLFLGAYRDNELAGDFIFATTVEAMQKEGCLVRKINLAPLPFENVAEIIAEMLEGAVQDNPALVRFVYDKSQGNPFFINAFLKSLHAEAILLFDFYTFQWTWDAAKMARLRFTENIVELLTGRIQKLPASAQELMKLAACLGYHFDVQLLMVVLRQTHNEIAGNLNYALEEDLILPVGDNYCFAHDRVQQAAYSLIPDNAKKNEHLRIGKALLQSMDAEAHNTYIFEIVNQLNAGIESIVTQEEKNQVAGLNLTAGIKAKSSAAYKPSFEYLQIGIELLHTKAWKDQYELSLQLYTEGAESGFLSGRYNLMEEWINVVLQNAATVLDQVKVYEIRIKSYTAQHRLLDAVRTSLEALKLLNVRFPKNPSKIHVLAALVQTELALARKPANSLIDLPLVKNPNTEAAIRLLSSVGSAVYFALPNLFPLMVCRGFLLMIRHGNTPYSGIVCTSYGMTMLAGVGNIKAGYQLGQTAMQLSEKFDAGSLKCQTRMMVNTFCVHWKEPLQNVLEPLLRNYWYGLENGNIEFATYSALVHCYNAFFCGRNLKELAEENNKFHERFQRLGHESAFNLHCICSQTVLNLYGRVQNPTILTGKVHNETEMIAFYTETKGEKALFKIYLHKLILSCIFGQYDEAFQNGQEANRFIKSVSGSSEIVVFYFYDTLTRLALLPQHPGKTKRTGLRKIQANIKIFKKFVRAAPMNCLHKLLLVQAELCRATSHPEKASLLYNAAAEEAKKNEYLNDLALIFECAGKFYLSQDRAFIAGPYLLQAYKYYQQWSAFTKVSDMEQKYPYLFEEEQPENIVTILPLPGTKIATADLPAASSSEELDLHSIMKAATAISSEVQLDKLLKKLVRIAVENAGAQQGYLILKKDDGFFIEAEGSIDAEKDVIVQSVSIKGNKSLSEAVVQFVYVTKEVLVLDNAMQHPHFSADPVITEKKSKSILCMPIIHQGDVFGLLYFENDLITSAFTQDRIELLKLLSGQMAISLQNALNEQKKMNAITEREQLVKEINLHQQELLKTKLEIQEQTYHNISEELHDNIGQVLSLIKINMNTIDVNVADLAKEKLIESKTLLTKVIRDIRDLSKTLNTDFIETIGLTGAIDQQLQFLKKTGLYTARLSVKGDVCNYESHRELVLFRIVQELLNNVIKHAEATEIDIVMEYRLPGLVVTLTDNGKGLDTEILQSSDNKGLGLRNIQNRIKLINGHVDFHSEPQKGTMVVLTIP